MIAYGLVGSAVCIRGRFILHPRHGRLLRLLLLLRLLSCPGVKNGFSGPRVVGTQLGQREACGKLSGALQVSPHRLRDSPEVTVHDLIGG